MKSETSFRKDIYNSEIFRKQGHQLVDMLSDYLNKAASGGIKGVLPSSSPDEVLKKWSAKFNNKSPKDLVNLINEVVNESNHLHNPRYIGHQVCAPLPTAALCDLISSFLNNSSAVFEMGPVSSVMEKIVINWMAGLIGFDKEAEGFLTSGGTVGNITALLAARQIKAGYDVWKSGVQSPLCIMVSEQAHYSIKRAAQIMGFGERGIILIPVDDNFSMNADYLETKYREAINSGRKVIAVVGSGCTTATGSYDPLDKIADFCKKYDLWFHVDGAHGASALLSDKYRHLLKGIEQADSVIWDAHKMMLMPALITAVIFKKGHDSYEAFSQKASYLFRDDPQNEWYNLAHRTMECTKNMMGLKLFTCLSVFGQEFFADYVTHMYDLTRKFAEMIEESGDFEVATMPQSNIICFRYVPSGTDNLDELQQQIRKDILKDESFYILETKLRNKVYLRCTVINPLTTEKEFNDLLDLIRITARV